jgi:hypothetical protein
MEHNKPAIWQVWRVTLAGTIRTLDTVGTLAEPAAALTLSTEAIRAGPEVEKGGGDVEGKLDQRTVRQAHRCTCCSARRASSTPLNVIPFTLIR